MARRNPGDARVEGIQQRRFPLPLRFLDAHVERRAHHETLELRLHDPVRAARTGQPQLVAPLRAHGSPSHFVSNWNVIILWLKRRDDLTPAHSDDRERDSGARQPDLGQFEPLRHG
jgi:hypothetical protein